MTAALAPLRAPTTHGRWGSVPRDHDYNPERDHYTELTRVANKLAKRINGVLTLDCVEVGEQVGISGKAVASRFDRMRQTRGEDAVPWILTRTYSLQGGTPQKKRGPTPPPPEPEVLKIEIAIVRAEAIVARADDEKRPAVLDTRCDGPGGVYWPDRSHTPAREPFLGPRDQAPGDAAKTVVATYLAEWKAGWPAALAGFLAECKAREKAVEKAGGDED